MLGDQLGVLLDTTVLVGVLRGRPGTTERLLSLRRHGDVPFTTAISVEEIGRGLRVGEHAAVDALFDGLRVLPIGRHEAEVAGDWRRDHAARGVTLSQADCLIAATALLAAASLATGNPRHFPMAELDVQHWPAGD